MPKKNSEHYVNNKELLDSIIVYRNKVKEASQKYYEKYDEYPPKSKRWEGKPPIPNYLGECFLKIATHLSYKPNFVNYMFRDDMISDGIENCFHRSTKIATIEYGPIEIEKIVGKEVTVRCKDGKWRTAIVKSYGTQMLYEYGFSTSNVSVNNVYQKVIATKNHRWFVTSRRNRRRTLDYGKTVVTDLRIGDCLENAPSEKSFDPNGVLHGLLYGDGSGHKTTVYGDPFVVKQGSKYAKIRVCKQDLVKDEIVEILTSFGYEPTYPQSANGDPCFYIGRFPLAKDLPFTTDPEYIAGFIYGWWLADGYKTTSSNRLQISTSNKLAADWLNEYSSYAGYHTVSYRKIERKENDGSFPNGKSLYVITLAKPENYEPKVRYITEYGRDEVFCLEESETNSFVLSNGLLTGNCVQYIHNFDPEKSTNPFAYFTQIIHYAFLRRIQKEKRQLEIKSKIIEKTGFDEVMTIDDGLLSGNNSEYNSMKDAIQYRNGNR
jgi:hypothetical protein